MRILMKVVLSLTILLVILLAIVWNQYQSFMTATLNVPEQGFTYTVRKGSNLQQISRDLRTAGLFTQPAEYLYLYGRLENKAHLIKAGEYHLAPKTTFPKLLNQLISGQVIQYPFTIIEGMTALELINTIAQDTRFSKTITDYSLASVMTQLALPKNHGEGEFLPETYYFTAGSSDLEMLARAHKSMTLSLDKAWKSRAENLPYKTPYEALIMASIIEKETGIAEERPQIAGVFVKRMQIGMRLQTDPTVIYGLGDKFNGNLRRKHLTSDTPYNTYTRGGLPPTPIALPSKESIDAALHPKVSKNLYFVATGKDGRHAFSANLAAHNKAVRKYQLKK